MLNQRQLNLLDFVIREHVKSARPISSGMVAKKKVFNISPATIRNEMQALEDSGFLKQLHTSGGRVPTDTAYRYYVNQLLNNPERLAISGYDKKLIVEALAKVGTDCRTINKTIARVLSEQTGDLIITGTDQEAEFFKQGLVSLFRHPEFQEIESLFQLTSFFEDFDSAFRLIEREFLCILGTPTGLPIQILIGHENPFRQIKDETIMCTKYLLPGDVIGSLTLIGPKRMNYKRNISLIKYTIDYLQKLNNL